MASAALSIRLVMARLRLSGSARARGRSWAQAAPDTNRAETAGEQRKGVVDDGVEVGGARLRGRELGESAELVDERTHRFHRCADDVGAAAG